MSERANAAVRVARAVLGVALNGAAESGAFGRGSAPALRAAAELVTSGGHERRPAPVAAPVAATDARRGARTAPQETAPPGGRGARRDAAQGPGAKGDAEGGGSRRVPCRRRREDGGGEARILRDGVGIHAPAPAPAPAPGPAVPTKPSAPIERRAVAVPSSPIQRVIGFGSLAAGLAAGTISESAAGERGGDESLRTTRTAIRLLPSKRSPSSPATRYS